MEHRGRCLLVLCAVLACAPTVHAQSTALSGQPPAEVTEPAPRQAAPGATAFAPALITFSEYPVGTFITTQYESLGVVFSGSAPFTTLDRANPTAPVLSGTPLFHGAITVTFVNPDDPTETAVANNVAFHAGYFDAIGSTTITYFDSDGAVVGSVLNTQYGIQHFVAPQGIGGFTISPSSNDPAGFAIDNLAFEVQPQELTLEATLIVPSAGPERVKARSSQAQTARFPLGSTFQVKLLTRHADGTYTDVPATFTLGGYQFSGTLDQRALFSSGVVMRYTRNNGEAAVFQAVHLGSQQLTITPQDTTRQPVSTTLSVQPPGSLGSSHPEVDQIIQPVADGTGVPPQMIKGQIAQEGGFDPLAWRYEPVNADYGDLGVSRPKSNYRTTTDPFTMLRLPTIGDQVDPGNCKTYPNVDLRIPDATCPGLAQGGMFAQVAMNYIATTRFKIRIPWRDPTTGEPIIDGTTQQPVLTDLHGFDRYVSARDVYTYSDPIYHWSSFASPGSSNKLTFTAQLTLAASYGYLQLMYGRAITDGWTGNTALCNGTNDPHDPSHLYDTECNLQNNGGSVGFGTRLTATQFYSKHGANPNIRDAAALGSAFQPAYQAYNPRKQKYGQGVITASHSYAPIAAISIFAAGGQ